MKKSFTQEQIVATLPSRENGTSVADACRKIGVTEQTRYRCKRKFAGRVRSAAAQAAQRRKQTA